MQRFEKMACLCQRCIWNVPGIGGSVEIYAWSMPDNVSRFGWFKFYLNLERILIRW